MDILKVLFIFIFVTFPSGVLIRISVTPQAYIYPVDGAVFLFVLVGISQLFVNKGSQKLLYPFSFFVIAAVLSLMANIYWLSLREFVVASLYLVRFSMYLLLIPVISSQFKNKDVRWLVSCITVSLFGTVLFGLLQYFLYPDLRNLIYLGWDEHLFRIFSSFLDPNFASVIFVICFWVSVTLFRIQKKNSWQYYGATVISIVTLIAILLTYSRTGFLVFGVSSVIFFVLERKIRLLILLLSLFVVGIFMLPKGSQSEGVNLLRTASVYSRLESFQTAQSIIVNNPIFGVGFNAYRYAQENQDIGQPNVVASHAGAGVSNSYLFVLATTGVVGFAAFLYGIVRLVQEVKVIVHKNQVFGSGMSAILAGILAGSLVENIFFYSFVLIILFVLLGIGRVVRADI